MSGPTPPPAFTCSVRHDLDRIAGCLDLMASQIWDANDDTPDRAPVSEETLSLWVNAASFLSMSVRRTIGELEGIETRLTGRPPSLPRGAWQFAKGAAS